VKTLSSSLAAIVVAVLPLHLEAQVPMPFAETQAKITPEQRTRLAQKLAHIEAVMRAVDLDRQAAATAETRQWMRETLYRLSLEQVESVPAVANVQSVTAAIGRAAKARGKLLGDNAHDLVYQPWAPCRYIDTRNVGGKISGVQTYDTSANGATYGGSVSCNPITLAGVATEDDIAAFTLNITLVDTSTAASPGFATMRPAGSANLTALVNWTVSSAGFQLGNAATVGTNQSPATGAEIEILTSGPVHAIVDLSGAFTSPVATPLQCALGTQTLTAALAPGATFTLFANTCPAGYRMVGNACAGTGDFFNIQLSGSGLTNTAQSYCQGKYVGATSTVVTNTPYCCRIPGH
jgi:hypothetical protein